MLNKLYVAASLKNNLDHNLFYLWDSGGPMNFFPASLAEIYCFDGYKNLKPNGLTG